MISLRGFFNLYHVGAKQAEPRATGFELRASWSPLGTEAAGPPPEDGADGGLAGHMAAWCGTMCAAAGLVSLHFVNITDQRPSVAPWRGRDGTRFVLGLSEVRRRMLAA